MDMSWSTFCESALRGTVAVFALCGAVSCAGNDGDEGAVAQQSAALLTLPGAWYTTAPQYATCLYRAVSVSAACASPQSVNSLGAVNGVTRVAPGQYRVFLGGMSANGNAQVVAIGNDNTRCNLATIGPAGGGVQAEVRCRSPLGAGVDSQFELSYYRETNVGGPLGAYARVRGFVAPLTVFDGWNSQPSFISAGTLGVGRYRVFFGGQTFPNGTVLVTSASGQPGHCKVAALASLVGAPGVQVDVNCFSLSGNPQNDEFSIAYHQNVRGDARNPLASGTQGGFSRVTPWAAVNPSFSRNTCAAGANTAAFLGAGKYTDKIHAIGASPAVRPSAALVTAFGIDASYCKLSQVWSAIPGADAVLDVQCFRGDGAVPLISEHNVMFTLQDGGGC
jgi:hypothetical protein